MLALETHRGERGPVRMRGHRVIERVVDRPVGPQARLDHRRSADLDVVGVELHVDPLGVRVVVVELGGARSDRWFVCRIGSGRNVGTTDPIAGDDGLHDLGCSVADLEAEDVA